MKAILLGISITHFLEWGFEPEHPVTSTHKSSPFCYPGLICEKIFLPYTLLLYEQWW